MEILVQSDVLPNDRFFQGEKNLLAMLEGRVCCVVEEAFEELPEMDVAKVDTLTERRRVGVRLPRKEPNNVIDGQ